MFIVCLIFTNATAALKATNVKTKRQHKYTINPHLVINNEERGYHDINSRILTITCTVDIVIYEKKILIL